MIHTGISPALTGNAGRSRSTIQKICKGGMSEMGCLKLSFPPFYGNSLHVSHWDGSSHKGVCYEPWKPEVYHQYPWEVERRKPSTPHSCPLTFTLLWHSSPTTKHYNNNKFKKCYIGVISEISKREVHIILIGVAISEIFPLMVKVLDNYNSVGNPLGWDQSPIPETFYFHLSSFEKILLLGIRVLDLRETVIS